MTPPMENSAVQANSAEITNAETPAVERITVRTKDSADEQDGSAIGERGERQSGQHGNVVFLGADPEQQAPVQIHADELDRKTRFAFLTSKRFWIVLCLTQALALGNTGTNTITTLLFREGTSIPAFQSLFNYVVLALLYGSITIYKKGFKGWARLVYRDGWKFFLYAFCDVQGNFFTVWAYEYTNILSAQLINFWAIAVVVLISLIFLKVRYNLFQYGGILICCGGLGLLLASDHIRGVLGGAGPSPVKGDLFALVGATGYGLSNIVEEFFVSKRSIYEVLGQLGFWGTIINGVEAAIFARDQIRHATWNGKVASYLVGYTAILSWFYSTAPIVFRMSSAAFFNIGLLTGNFWGVIVGTQLFHEHVQYLYPVAFVLIIGGHFVYYGTEGVLGESRKPWLGEDQEGGSDGLGTARRQLEHPRAVV